MKHKYIYVYVHIVLGRKTREATKMINMEKVKAECKEWQPKSGQARYYIDNWNYDYVRDHVFKCVYTYYRGAAL